MQQLITGAAKLGIKLNAAQVEQFQTYYYELVDWNRRINLTAIIEPEEVQLKHFLDSLTVALAFKEPADTNGLKVIDIGSGAGFPGLPLKIAFPSIDLTLLEATAKKVKFLNHIAQKLGLDKIEVVAGRAEETAIKAEYRERFDAVLSRAVALLPTLAELTLPFCKTGGGVILQKKGDTDNELCISLPAIGKLGGGQPAIKRIKLPELPDDRFLVIIKKVKPTPLQYPRRSGIPAKRPIV